MRRTFNGATNVDVRHFAAISFITEPSLYKARGKIWFVIDLTLLCPVSPALAKWCSPVPFFGRTAYMPRRGIELAHETGSGLWMFFGEIDRVTLKQHIRFEPVDLTHGVDAAFADYAARLEAAIVKRPGLWQAWGDVSLYFMEPDRQ